jgi:hypothetical protein
MVQNYKDDFGCGSFSRRPSPCTLLTCRAHDGERLAREETVEDSHDHPRDQGLHRGHVVLHDQLLLPLDGFKGRVG